ncbi:MAG: hypothetical protein IJ565_05155 [Bacilli bacterium]|nr:hypothetical protein [Bacilli bacterium]
MKSKNLFMILVVAALVFAIYNMINNSKKANANQPSTSTQDVGNNSNGDSNQNTPTIDTNSNKIIISTMLENKGTYDYTNKIVDLGVPLSAKYPGESENNVLSRNVWDLQAYNNKIYIGSGDYDKNTGPVDIYSYNTLTNQFVKEVTVDDEQINRFVIIDGKLMAPGIDRHSGGWDLGNYYVLENGKWTTKTIKDAIHNFDLIKYNGALYAGIGNDSDSSIIKTTDNGNSWSYVYMYDINGNKITVTEANSAYTRVYDLFEFKNNLYAISNYKIYKYIQSDNIFKEMNNKVVSFGSSPVLFYFPLKTKMQYKNNMVFVNGMIGYTNDLENFTYTSFDRYSSVNDMVEVNNELYVLCNTVIDNVTYVSVYKTNDLTTWNPVMYFEYTDPAKSFEFVNNAFYFGFGSTRGSFTTTTIANSGRIIKVPMN